MGLSTFGGKGPRVDVAKLLDSEIPTWVAGLVDGGAMVSISTTSDGGALMLQVTMDGEWTREYFRESEEAVAWLEAVHNEVLAINAQRPASPAPGFRSRGRQRA